MALPPSFDADMDAGAQPKAPELKTFALWLVAASLAVFAVTLLLIAANLRNEVAGLRGDLAPLRATLAAAGTPEPEIVELRDALARLERSIAEIGQAGRSIAAERVDWPAMMAAIGGYDPTQLTLVAIKQNPDGILLQGRAASEAAVGTYTQWLEASGLFASVSVRSLKAMATPAATATARLTPSPEPSPTATPSSTPDTRDDFEPDDVEPHDIFLGQPQTHSFCPDGDIDQVRFLAKSGRMYRVYTSDLAPGVDTLLTVRVGEATYVNDDVGPGTLSSEVTFQVPIGLDVQAVVEIRNRGHFGPQMSYRITCAEIIPTKTPQPSVTPSPTRTPDPTATPTATATAAPSEAAGAGGPRRRRAPGLARMAPNPDRQPVEFAILLVPEVAP